MLDRSRCFDLLRKGVLDLLLQVTGGLEIHLSGSWRHSTKVRQRHLPSQVSLLSLLHSVVLASVTFLADGVNLTEHFGNGEALSGHLLRLPLQDGILRVLVQQLGDLLVVKLWLGALARLVR